MGLLEGRLLPFNTELTFVGRYGTMVHMCSDPTTPSGKLTVGQAAIGDSPAAVLIYATALKNKHLILHREAGTKPCSADADPVSAIYINKAMRAIWIPVTNLTSSVSSLPTPPPRLIL
ncbi:hypothetical protein HZA75_01205 [Candidatus Roizmanbacteria bacterium]|nr:hypothetical protein [Candidatus Roizmanbacteria bacterium]